MYNPELYSNLFDINKASAAYSSYSEHASATPSKEKEVVRPIEWKTLPKVRPLEWHEETKTRNAVKSIFFFFGTLAAGGMVFSASWLVASAKTIVLATVGFGLLSSVLIISGIYLATRKTCLLDPDYRSQMRKEIETGVEEHHEVPTYSCLCASLQAHFLTEDEVQGILFLDISKMDFISFEKKHGQVETLMLDSTNKELLLAKYFDFIKTENMGLKSILNTPKSSYFDLKIENLPLYFVSNEIHYICRQHMTYSEFISRNGHQIIAYVTDPSPRNILITKFQEEVLKATADKGDIQAKKDFAKDFAEFGEAVEQDTLIKVVGQALLSQAKGTFNYKALRATNSPALLQTLMEQYVDFYMEMRCGFLNMPYAEMRLFYEDTKFLTINVNDIHINLENRWRRETIQNILKSNSEDFFLSLSDKIFEPLVWTKQLLADTHGMPLKEILSLDCRLITSGILGAQTVMQEAQTLSEALAREIYNYRSFENLLDDYQEIIFSEKLCADNDPTIARLTVDFVHKHAESLLHGTPVGKVAKGLAIIEKYSLLPLTDYALMQETKRTLENLKKQYAVLVEKINQTYTNQVALMQAENESKILQAKQNSKFSQLTSMADGARASKISADNNLKNELNLLHEAKSSFDNVQAEITADLTNLQQKNLALVGLNQRYITAPSFLERTIQLKRDFIANLNVQIEHSLQVDPGLIQARSAVNALEVQLDDQERKFKEQVQYEKVCRDFNQLSIRLSDAEARKEILAQKIEECKNAREETQGLFAALSALNSPLKTHESELASILSDEADFKILKAQVRQGKGMVSSAYTATILNNIKKSLCDGRAIITQKEQVLQHSFNMLAHKKELADLKEQLNIARGLVQKIQALETEINLLTNQISRKKIVHSNFSETFIVAQARVEKAEREAVIATEACQEIEADLFRASQDWENCKKVYEKTFRTFKHSLKVQHSVDLEKAELQLAADINEAEFAFKKNRT